MSSKRGMNVTFRDYIEGYSFFLRELRDIVHPASINRLQLVESKLISLLGQRGQDIGWEIIIPQSDPLKFKEFVKDGNRLEIQLNCKIKGTVVSLDAKELSINEYNIEIWIRSLEKNLSYRPDFDSKRICKKLSENDWRRVVMSFHVDLKKSNTTIFEPKYHLHAGGRLAEHELCWIPDTLDEPRFYFFPLDLVLLSEFILMNFQPEKYEELRKKPEWKKQIIYSQSLYLKPYISKFNDYLDDNSFTLLHHLAKVNNV